MAASVALQRALPDHLLLISCQPPKPREPCWPAAKDPSPAEVEAVRAKAAAAGFPSQTVSEEQFKEMESQSVRRGVLGDFEGRGVSKIAHLGDGAADGRGDWDGMRLRGPTGSGVCCSKAAHLSHTHTAWLRPPAPGTTCATHHPALHYTSRHLQAEGRDARRRVAEEVDAATEKMKKIDPLLAAVAAVPWLAATGVRISGGWRWCCVM